MVFIFSYTINASIITILDAPFSPFGFPRISNAELRGGLSMRIPIALTPIAHANAKG
jgi:hypothetical protein